MRMEIEQAENLLWGGHDDEYTFIEDVFNDSGRWLEYRTLVIKEAHTDKLWAADFERGLTEYQECRPWEDCDSVLFYPVEKVAVTRHEYRKVN